MLRHSSALCLQNSGDDGSEAVPGSSIINVSSLNALERLGICARYYMAASIRSPRFKCATPQDTRWFHTSLARWPISQYQQQRCDTYSQSIYRTTLPAIVSLLSTSTNSRAQIEQPYAQGRAACFRSMSHEAGRIGECGAAAREDSAPMLQSKSPVITRQRNA